MHFLSVKEAKWLTWAGAGWVMGVETPDVDVEVGKEGEGDWPWLAMSELTLSLDGESLR